MELTSQTLRQVEFGSELRGYKTSEVDDFLEQVALAVDQLRNELAEVAERAERAERLSSERLVLDDEESIRRTLVLAQRTADLAIKEAQEEAAQLLDGARADAEGLVAEARQSAERIAAEADKRFREEVGRLTAERDRLRNEIDALVSLLAAERERLTESLTGALRFVERNLAVSPEVAGLAVQAAPAAGAATEPARAAVVEPDVDELEAAIAEDAAAAAPSLPPRREEEAGEESYARPSLMALPSLEEFDGEPDRHDTEPTAAFDFNNQAGSPGA